MNPNTWRIGVSCLLASFATGFAQTNSTAWTNGLGMVFVLLQDQGIRFSIWETRVKDYAVFVEEGSWAKAWPQKPNFKQGTNEPVVNVGWDEAKEFCLWLTKRERALGLISSNQVYRLPSDHEWSVEAASNWRRENWVKRVL